MCLAVTCPLGGQTLHKSAFRLITLLHIIIRHHLHIAFIQIKLAVGFLLPCAKLAQAVFMLKGAVKLLFVIGKRLFHAFASGFLVLGIAVKVLERIFNASYRA